MIEGWTGSECSCRHVDKVNLELGGGGGSDGGDGEEEDDDDC